MSGSLKVYCVRSIMAWEAREGPKDGIENQRRYLMSDYLLDDFPSIKKRRRKDREIELLSASRCIEFKKYKQSTDDKHLLYEKDKAPSVVLTEGATMLMPNGEKLKVLESTCDIDGNVVYVVDKAVEVDSDDIEKTRQKAVSEWLKLEYPHVYYYQQLEAYKDSPKSPYDLYTEQKIKDIENEYHEPEPEEEKEPEQDMYSAWIAMMESENEDSKNRLIPEGARLHIDNTPQNMPVQMRDLVAGVVVAIPPIGFVALLIKLVFFGG